MENSEVIIKSLLKKSVSSDHNKSKKVSFCNTVKVFIDDPSKSIKSNVEEGTSMKWLEISIVDKSIDKSSSERNDECKETDFLVHKVIYDNYVLPENDEDLDIINENDHSLNSIVLESVSDDEGLEFVVHKVTDHEDDLIKQESELDNSVDENENSELENSDVITKPFSKLSVENILEHDKIIAFIDQRNLAFTALKPIGVTGDSPCERKGIKVLPDKVDNSLVLSPPLQELSIDKIVKAHSDNILCELDISPLNSVQESDSESDLSSEGTMIMMTSEECQKNEQHIRESFLQYQSRKKLAEAEIAKSNEPSCEYTESDCDTPDTIYQTNISDVNLINESDESNSEVKVNTLPPCKGSSNSDKLNNAVPYNSNFDSYETNPHKRSNSLPISDVAFSQPNKQGPKFFSAMRRSSFDSCAPISVKPSTLIKIPSDVREWKILLDSCGKNEGETVPDPSMQSNIENTEKESFPNSDPHLPNHAQSLVSKTDELESFVNESTERVERIRKRYHISDKQNRRFGNLQNSPVRGIRPRFGSTAEILQMMQKQHHPPVITFGGTKNHMSWPCDETGSDSVLGMHSSRFYTSQSLSRECSSQSSIDSYCDDSSNTSSCDHYSISSCPSIILHERGSPEGASPSRHHQEICDSSSEHNSFHHSDSYVYYSMKV